MGKLFGYERGELIGSRASQFMKPELRHLFDTEYLAALKEVGRYQGVTACYTKDGRKLYLENVSTLVKPEHGEPFISGIARDVTHRVNAERAIKEREQRIQAIFEASPNPLVVYDKDGNVVYLNPAFTRVFGWTQQELEGTKAPYVPEDEKDRTAPRIRELYPTGESGTMESRRLTKDGRVLDVLLSAAMIKGPKGRPAGTVVSLTDLTEKKRMEAGLLQVQKMEAIAVLAGGVAHDFNNLLMGILGNTSLMLMDLEPGHPCYRRLKDIEQYAQQGSMLTKQLLGFARGGKHEVRSLDLNNIIEAHNQVFARTRKDIRIVEDYEKDLWTVAADESQVRQILMNLYINAADVMPDGGNITVKTQNIVLDEQERTSTEIKPGRYVQLSVSDTGFGMDKETQKRIFEPFFTTKEKSRGTGLGLASVYGIVNNHGGFIDVISEEGKGSTFRIYFPAAA
jgi:PAS domain S-box-containing protein